MPRPFPVLLLVLGLAVAPLAACSSDSDGAADDGGAPTTATTSTTTTVPIDETTGPPATEAPLEVLVSDDDGYAAEGIDVLVEALRGLDGVTVTVVAPLEQQSGTGGKTTEGPVEVTDVETASGYPAKAVDGFPSDSIRVAIDELGLQPDVVITGINEGQNLGPAVDLSGTIGAARAAVARDIPALATSQGLTADPDYASAVPFILDWIAERRAALADGTAPVQVDSINVPTCEAGEVRGLVEVEPDPEAPMGEALGVADCTSTAAEAELEGDVATFLAGFATMSTVQAMPAA